MVGFASCVCLIVLSAPAQAGDRLPVIEDADMVLLQKNVGRIFDALQKLRSPFGHKETEAIKLLLNDGRKSPEISRGLQELLDPHCLVAVSINPESRVKAARGPAKAILKRGSEAIFLIKVVNEAGVNHALAVSGPEIEGDSKWLKAIVHSEPPMRKTLSGEKIEYVLLRLSAPEIGKREATLKFDVGQGTQDLGFRAEVPVLFTISK